jgi:hypothetical protein
MARKRCGNARIRLCIVGGFADEAGCEGGTAPGGHERPEEGPPFQTALVTGFAFGINIDFCSFWGCYDVYTIRISELSMMHESTNAGPLEGSMDIGEAGCPSVGLIPGAGFLNPISIGFCEDLGLNGRPFNTTVASIGAANPSVYTRYAFTNASKTVQLRPDAMQVSVPVRCDHDAVPAARPEHLHARA